jgi:hypothetical protein
MIVCFAECMNMPHLDNHTSNDYLTFVNIGRLLHAATDMLNDNLGRNDISLRCFCSRGIVSPAAPLSESLCCEYRSMIPAPAARFELDKESLYGPL